MHLLGSIKPDSSIVPEAETQARIIECLL